MTHLVLAETAVNVSELMKVPTGTVAGNEVFMDRLEDIELNELADARAAQPEISVSLDGL